MTGVQTCALPIFAPAGTPAATVGRLNAAINQVMNSKELATRLQQLRVEPSSLSAAEYENWLVGQSQSWSKLIKEAGVVVD